MIYYNETDLHAMLDSLTDGEHIKTTWKMGQVEVTAEGPVYKDDLQCSCLHIIRWNGGEINPTLTSLEATRDEEVTATRDDDEELIALIDSLEDGQEVTAELGNREGSIFLRAVTVRRTVVQRWEREGNE